MKALDFIQIFASNVRRLDFRLSSAQVILAVIAHCGWRTACRKPAGQKYIPRHMKNPLLSTEEKRRWLARVFRDEDGEYSQADKFKALVEDTKLAALQQEEEEFKRQREMGAEPQDPILALLQSLPPAELNLNNHPSS